MAQTGNKLSGMHPLKLAKFVKDRNLTILIWKSDKEKYISVLNKIGISTYFIYSAKSTSHWCSQVFIFCRNKKAVMCNGFFCAYQYKKLFQLT